MKYFTVLLTIGLTAFPTLGAARLARITDIEINKPRDLNVLIISAENHISGGGD